MVAVARAVFPTTLGVAAGTRLPATAMLAGWEIDQAHARSDRTPPCAATKPGGSAPSSGRPSRNSWPGWRGITAPTSWPSWPRTCWSSSTRTARPQRRRTAGQRTAPVRLSRRRGCRLKGRLDSATFEVLSRAVRAVLCPPTDEGKTLGERQADALGKSANTPSTKARLPLEGGGAPACHRDPGLPVECANRPAG